MQQLTNATELLEMLEHIFDSRSSEKGTVQSGGGEVFPWSGVKLTLGLAREQLQSARSELAAGTSAVLPAELGVSANPDSRP